MRKDNSINERLILVEEIFISSIALGELYFGAFKSGRVKENLARINEFANGNIVVDCNIITAHKYGLIKSQLKEKGRLIPENDIWISAIAQQYDLILITRDNHFSNVNNLRYEIW